MLNFNPESGVESLKSNQRAIERHINDDHYVRSFFPGDFILGPTGTPAFAVIPLATPRWPVVVLPKHATENPICAAGWRKPSQWRSGRLRVRYFYTSPVGSTNNFRVLVTINAARTDEVLPSTGLLGNSATVAGPAVANTRMASPDIYSTVSLGSDDQAF